MSAACCVLANHSLRDWTLPWPNRNALPGRKLHKGLILLHPYSG